MYSTEHDEAGDGYVVHTTIKVEDAETPFEDASMHALKITIGDVDLPAFVSHGTLYVQAPLPLVFKAFAEDLSEFLSDLEVRVSTAGGTPFPLDRDGRPVHRTRVAKSRVVRSGGKRR